MDLRLPDSIADEDFLASFVEIRVGYDPKSRCECGCGYPAMMLKKDVVISRIGPICAAILFAAASRVLADAMNSYTADMEEDDRQIFTDVLEKELERAS